MRFEEVQSSLETVRDNQQLMAANSATVRHRIEENIRLRTLNLVNLEVQLPKNHQEIQGLMDLEQALKMENEFEQQFVVKPERQENVGAVSPGLQAIEASLQAHQKEQKAEPQRP